VIIKAFGSYSAPVSHEINYLIQERQC